MKLIKILSGITLAIVSLWLGAYLMHTLEKWAEFPAYFTAVAGVVGGALITILGLGEDTQ